MTHWLFIAVRTSFSFLPYSSYVADSSLHANFDLAHNSTGIDSVCNSTQLHVLYQLPEQYLVQINHSGLNAPGEWQDRNAMSNA